MEKMTSLNKLAETLQNLYTKYSQKNWTFYTTGYDFGVNEAHQKINKFYQDKSNFELILDLKAKDLDFRQKREVEILYNIFEPYHLSDELNEIKEQIDKLKTKVSGVLNQHRCVVDGQEFSSVEIFKMISESSDEKVREKAWRSLSQVNKPVVEAGFIELHNLRNEFAKQYGEQDFVEYKLKKNEISPATFNNWDNELKKMLPVLKNEYKSFAQSFLQKEKLFPWDDSFVENMICEYNVKEVNMIDFLRPISELYDQFGFDIKNQNITYDVFPRKNKSEWGYQFTIEPGKDSRVLANISNKYQKYNVLLHETGHANHFNSLNPEDVILNLGVSGIIAEGVANLFGGMQLEEIFYSQFFKGNDVKEQFDKLKSWRKKSSLTSIELILFDQELHRSKIETLDDINDLRLKYMNEMSIYDFSGEPPWAYVIHHTTHPVYLHNYFMGDVTCEMLKKVFCRKYEIESIYQDPSRFGTFLLEEVIRPSGLYTFNELFNKVSGEDFSLKYISS
jgi:oligoendopeptidase F